jgi:hypothetical protein
LWTSCGELRGKCGEFTVVFRELRIGHVFELYFFFKQKRGAEAPLLR